VPTANLFRLTAAAALVAAVAALVLSACGGTTPSPAAPTGPGSPKTPPSLPTTLQSGCLGWPATDFSPANKASVATFLAPGQRAIDFALRDTAGIVVRLSELLATRPVLLVTGSFT